MRKGEESPVGDFQWDISPNQLSCEVICECPFGGGVDKDISYMNIYRAFSLQGNVEAPRHYLGPAGETEAREPGLVVKSS